MIIDARYNGPADTGNGGYSAGLLATQLSGASAGVEVTLRRPPPLGTELTLRDLDGGLAAFHGDDLIATARPAPLDPGEVVAAVPFGQAAEVSPSYRGFVAHPFPGCFVCGPDRVPGDGLRLFPGLLADGRTATPFVAPADVDPVLVWAALDCPGGWAVPMQARPYVLGRMTASVRATPTPGERCVVMGQMTREAGRKADVRTTLYSGTGAVLAQARATWIAIPAAPVGGD